MIIIWRTGQFTAQCDLPQIFGADAIDYGYQPLGTVASSGIATVFTYYNPDDLFNYMSM